MVELPHFFGLDFSAASSWIFVGFLSGALLSWLWRALRGARSGAKAEEKIGEMQSLLDASRAEHQSEIARLRSDASNFAAALADAERRVSLAGGELTALRTQAGRLGQLELATRNELLTADKELARLRSELQWARTQTAALEREKLASGLDAVKAAKNKDADVARLQGELGGARALIDKLQDEANGHTQALKSAQSNYDQAWKDLAYVRNLAHWQAGEVDRLRGLITSLEGDIAAKAQALTALQQQHAGLKARLIGPRKGLGGYNRRIAYLRSQGIGIDEISADGHAHAKGTGRQAFVHQWRDANLKTPRARAYKPGKAYAAAGGGSGGGGKPGSRGASISKPSQGRVPTREIADLKAKLAKLTQDAERYHRLRDAVHVANRIADDVV
ncbi:MAG TPA: hypothetical protein PKD49_04655 [Hyphomicrobium sp.]|nr:hypothetical protein [Hyphomicrobium sp.]